MKNVKTNLIPMNKSFWAKILRLNERVFFVFFLSLMMANCGSQSNREDTNAQQKKSRREDWKTDGYIDKVQILLTNEFQFRESGSQGASSFLLKAKNDTLLCTAKHLLGEAMAMSPEIKVEEFNSSLIYWKSYPRNFKISNDTIYSKKLITDEPSNADIILQSCQIGQENDVVALTPRFTKPDYDERFELIGCEYSDLDCHQRIYYATFEYFQSGFMVLKTLTNFVFSGFSGAPVIDANGLAIGLLYGGKEVDGELHLFIEPLVKVKSYLQ